MPRSPQPRRPLALAATLLAASALAGDPIEYLPPTEWDEPPVVEPGATDDSPPSDAIVLFDGADLSAWHNSDNWRVEEGVMICGPGWLTSKRYFGDCQVHLEWSAPEEPEKTGQHRGNSGVFLMGQYEVQVLDSHENRTYPDGQAAAIYKQTPPMANATRPPGEWNTYDIFWRAPRFLDDGTVDPAVVSVVHNGVLVVDRHEVLGATGWDRPPDYRNYGPRGPIALQHHGSPVRYRNVWVRELRPPTGSERPARYHNHANGRSWAADEPIGEANPAELETHKDIDYVGAGVARQTLDLYLPKNRDRTRPLPLVAYIHGGGWRHGSKDKANLVKRLAESGRYAAASIGYRLTDEAVWPAQIHDCKAAIRWLRANAKRHGYDPQRIGVWGISAGGHLVAMLGVSRGSEFVEGDLGPHTDASSEVACVVNWFGPSDLTAMGPQGTELSGPDAPQSLLVGGAVEENAALARTASPIHYASADDAPMLIVHGTRDPLVPFEQSAELLHALQSAGAPIALLAVQGAGHGGLGGEANRLCYEFIDARLGGQPFEMGYRSIAGPGWRRTHPAGDPAPPAATSLAKEHP
ncbi:family 16 glycoside hydrolase [Botrimarina sp.]|uniref:family 16 glycoside hydrolase n=1 Tax=Botrimarina sp. TaxID=2795802 RepID=UPI0032EF6A84